MNKTRELNRYDIAKMIAAILVVMRHSFGMYTEHGIIQQNVVGETIPYIVKLISFNMPFFIFLSGVVFGINKNMGKYDVHSTFIKNKAIRLLIPYCVLATFYVFPTMVVLGLVDSDNYILYFVRSYLFVENSRHLWYLPCLFLIAILCNQFYGVISKNKVLSIILCALFFYFPFRFTYIFGKFQHLLVYYVLGLLFSSMEFRRYSKKKELFLFLVCLSLTSICGLYFGKSIFTGVLGIVSFLYLSDMLTQCKEFTSNGFVKSLSKNGFGIYLFHPMILYVLYFFNKNTGNNPYIMASCFWLISYLVSFQMSLFVKKHDRLKFIIGA